MLVFFSARRLKGDQWDEFRKAWAGGSDEAPEGLPEGSVVYHARNIKDEDEVISFGIFDMTKDDWHRWRGEHEAEENKRVDMLSAFVENDHISGVYEVIEEITD
jgi:hypothetical protein